MDNDLRRLSVVITAVRNEHQRLRCLIRTLPDAEALELVDEYQQTRQTLDKLEQYRNKLMQR